MILYHGTNVVFNKIDLNFCKELKDFGRGFYTTDDIGMAKRWAYLNKVRGGGGQYIYSFKVDFKDLRKVLNIHEFKPGISWVDYILLNRQGLNKGIDYDIVIGPTADARAQIEIDKFCQIYGGIRADKELKLRLINALHTERLNKQYCFKTMNSIRLLEKSVQVKEIWT